MTLQAPITQTMTQTTSRGWVTREGQMNWSILLYPTLGHRDRSSNRLERWLGVRWLLNHS